MFLDKLNDIVTVINEYTADYILVILLIAVGLFFTIRTRFVQVRCFGEGMKRMFGGFSLKGGKQKGGMSSFQALATAIAAQVGTGNIVGACGAILVGGPGAIFWMWIIAFLGMATIYAEAVLAQKTRVVDADGNAAGGPVYYIRTLFKGTFGKILAGFFAVAATLALGFMGVMVQSNSITGAIAGVAEKVGGLENVTGNTVIGGEYWYIGVIVGAVLAILAAVIFIGGSSRVASVTEKMVPMMAILYIVLCLAILISRITYIPETFGMIFKYAFNPNALIGGGVGVALKKAISMGAKRGLFSNEAGMGSTPHAHAMAKVEHPHDQGVVAMIGVFIDTFIVLTLTALTVISSLYAGNGPLAQDPTGTVASLNNANMSQAAFGMLFGDGLGSTLVAICLFFFAFSTIVGWGLFGKINFQHLFGKKTVVIYSIISVGFVFLGACLKNDLVWNLTDMFNYLMVIPNAIAIVGLSGLVVKIAKEGTARKKAKKAGKEPPTFD
ncbi:MAG: sodium:alanine symporter family protein [Clostridia bacterium]|nr:sodium:alanine symporter family protein [Clostridia bacterium]